ncbi:hypothetical protein A6R68_20508 [Neotoma lepida]|uniref:C-type lectin domain-containing protein n=1 Tax=Neotoma lepida TaxID=56216 RepID=A0A1A6HST9_NEOLE|nr:hypothetical protein A6R68_20508 [Neotoma lepida]
MSHTTEPSVQQLGSPGEDGLGLWESLRDWVFFHGNCYFFSKSQRNWHNSITACREVGAQLVITETDEEQVVYHPSILLPAGFLDRGHILLVLQLLLLILFAGLLVGIVIQVSKIPSSEEMQWEQTKQEKMYRDLSQLKSEVDSLCRLCPWDWTFFNGNCYFFSKSQRDWHNSITACQEMGAQLVIVRSHEEQSFLQQTSKKNGYTWMGLSDLNKEGSWYWLDGSPLSHR